MKDLVIDAFLKGLRMRRPAPGLIVHSDRGAQYASLAVRNVLRQWQARQSMGGRKNCFDNKVMESYFISLKRELVHLETLHSKAQAQRVILEYIEIFYNR